MAALSGVSRRIRGAEQSPTVEADSSKRPLFILLDATWTEAQDLSQKPIWTLADPQPAARKAHAIGCVAQRAVSICAPPKWPVCLDLAGDTQASAALDAYFDVFSQHYLDAKPVAGEWSSTAHQELGLKPFRSGLNRLKK
jgi:DTW domain-containing protein YfiP